MTRRFNIAQKEFKTIGDTAQWMRFLRKFELDSILENFTREHFGKALELGCGSGEHSQHLAVYCQKLIALEYNQDRLTAQSNNKTTFIVGNAEDLSQFGDDEMDLVFSSNLIEHLTDPVRCLSECKRVVKPDGLVIHTVPNRMWKTVGLLLYYPHLLKTVFRLLFSSKQKAKAETAQKATSKIDHNLRPLTQTEPLKRKILRRLLPSPHGISKGNFSELLNWGEKRWKSIFHESGLEVAEIVRLPFYGHNAEDFRLILELGNCMRLSSSTAYVLKKSH